jgi:hypothetical protein
MECGRYEQSRKSNKLICFASTVDRWKPLKVVAGNSCIRDTKQGGAGRKLRSRSLVVQTWEVSDLTGSRHLGVSPPSRSRLPLLLLLVVALLLLVVGERGECSRSSASIGGGSSASGARGERERRQWRARRGEREASARRARAEAVAH